MADYKRFVSYIYEYVNGTKKKNVGYVRVETRNNECRFTIHMQLNGLSEGIFPTYLIHRPKDEMDLVYLGDSVVRNQIMDSKLKASEFNTMDSGFRFSDMGGLLLFLNTGVFYATEWDDKPVVQEEVMEALKPKSKSKTSYDIRDDAIEKTAEAKEKQEDVNIPDTIKTESTISKKKPLDTIPVLVRRPIDIKTDTTKRKEEILGEAARPAYILPGGGSMKVGMGTARPKAPINPWDLVDRYNKSEAESMKASKADGEKPSDTPSKEIASKAIHDIDPPLDDAMNKANPLVARIFASYPRLYPFEDNEVSRCVKVEPKDIGALPSDTWVLSNNSFLLHGYYCYHHLIFAEISDRYGCRYVLGVPGIYHDRERFMARMFGFESFKSIRKRELKQGDFGYWYMYVNF